MLGVEEDATNELQWFQAEPCENHDHVSAAVMFKRVWLRRNIYTPTIFMQA